MGIWKQRIEGSWLRCSGEKKFNIVNLRGSDQLNYTDGHENKIDPSMFEKDYVLKDDQEQNKPQYKTDNFTEKKGGRGETCQTLTQNN